MSEFQQAAKDVAHEAKSALPSLFKIGVIVILLVVGLMVVGNFVGWFGEASRVAREEFGPRALMDKYQWFLAAKTQLDAKKMTIELHESRLAELNKRPRSEWSRYEHEDQRQWMTEMLGTKASYNLLAGEYNASMANFARYFTNPDTLPPNATVVLPEQYGIYIQE